MNGKRKNILVLGLGNPILGDDRLGLMLIGDLQKIKALNQRVRFQTSTQAGLYLLDLLIGFQQAVFIDSIICPLEKAGGVKLWPLNDTPSYVLGSSPHYIGVSSMIAIGKRLNLQMPEKIWLIGISIKDGRQIGEALSPEIEKQYPQILKQVQYFLEEILTTSQELICV